MNLKSIISSIENKIKNLTSSVEQKYDEIGSIAKTNKEKVDRTVANVEDLTKEMYSANSNINNISNRIQSNVENKRIILDGSETYSINPIMETKITSGIIKGVNKPLKADGSETNNMEAVTIVGLGDNEVSNGIYPIKFKTTVGSVVNEKKIELAEPLRSVMKIADTLDFSTMTVNRKIKKLVLNGTEDWKTGTLSNSNFNSFYIDITDANIPTDTSKYANIIATKFYTGSVVDQNYLYFGCVCLTNNTMQFTIESATAADVSAFKTWLASNNITVFYELTTPVTEQISIYDEVVLEPNCKISFTNEIPVTGVLNYRDSISGYLNDIHSGQAISEQDFNTLKTDIFGPTI